MRVDVAAASLLALLTGAAVLLPPPAHAATVTSRNGCTAEGRVCGSTTVFRAAAGEANLVSVVAEAGAYLVTDAGAALVAGGACRSLDVHRVSCPRGFAGPSGGGDSLGVGLGDGDDEAMTTTPATLSGGAGDDVLRAAGDAVSRLVGGEGEDRLLGGDGADLLQGGSGKDQIDGGGERDTVDYSGSGDPVLVHLPLGIGGTAAEADTLRDVEHAVGGDGSDVLLGDAGPNELSGGSGADVLVAAGGDDRLDGGEGDDVLRGAGGADDLLDDAGTNHLDGGSGDDVLAPPSGRRAVSRVDCGSGSDRVAPGAPGNVVARGCERVRVGLYLEVARRPRIRRSGAATFVVTACHAGCRSGTLSLRVGDRLVGQGRIGRDRRRLVARLNRRGRQLLRRGPRRLVRVEWREDGRGRPRYGYSTVL